MLVFLMPPEVRRSLKSASRSRFGQGRRTCRGDPGGGETPSSPLNHRYGRFTYHSVNSEQRPPGSKRRTKTLSYTRSTSPSAVKYVLVPTATAASPSAAKHA